MKKYFLLYTVGQKFRFDGFSKQILDTFDKKFFS